MRNILLSLIAFLAVYLLTFAQPYPRNQHVSAGEYFLDTDPGEGNGIPIEGMYGFAFANVNFDLEGIPLGTVIYVRFQSTNGFWSSARSIKYQDPLPNSGAALVYAEYFVNDDPGYGQGTEITINPGGTISIPNLPANIGDLICIRVKDSFGRWSPVHSKIYQDPAPNSGAELVYAEYFINDDPGCGQGTEITINPGGALNIPNLPANVGDLICIRVKDSFGRWSPVHSKIYQDPAPNSGAELIYAEYFINDDPGLGQGYAIPIGPSGQLGIPSLNIERDDAVYFRVKDSFNRWSAASNMRYEYKTMRAAEFYMKYTNGDTSEAVEMSVGPHTNPANAFYNAAGSTIPEDRIDSIFIRLQTEDYIWGEWTGIDGPPSPDLAVSDDTLDFGYVPVNTNEQLLLKIFSVGDTTLIINNIVTSNPPVFHTDFNQADSILNPGDSLYIIVIFSPQMELIYDEQLTINANTYGDDIIIALMGNGGEGIDIPDTVRNLTVSMSYPDIILTWSQVNTSIVGTPLNVDYYLIFFEENLGETFNFLSYTSDTTYQHQGVLQFSLSMFYYVEAYIGGIDLFLDALEVKKPDSIQDISIILKEIKKK